MHHHIAAILVTTALVGPASADVLVFAASSLKEPLDQIAATYQGQTGTSVVISFAGSAQLARQIQAGAPADIFISASEDWMDTLEAAGLITPTSRTTLAANSLVVIAHGADAPSLALANLADALGGQKLAMALVASVPAGVYGKQALTSLGLWDAISGSVAQADNVRAALKLVALGEAPFGITYATDALVEPQVSVVATFPPETHSPITYPAALTNASRPEAKDFLDALTAPAAQAIFAAQGFTPPT